MNEEKKEEGRLFKAVFPFVDGQEVPTGAEYISTLRQTEIYKDGVNVPSYYVTVHYFLCWIREGELMPIDNPFEMQDKKDKDELF